MRSNSGINQSDHVDRARRVGEFVRREITDLIKNEFNDPRFNLVTVTDVRLTRDLRHATVFVSRADLIGELATKARLERQAKNRRPAKPGKAAGARTKSTDSKKAGAEGNRKKGSKREQPDYVVALNRASARIRHLLAQRMTTKSTPTLHFEFDEVLEQGHRISSILESTALEAEDNDDQRAFAANPDLPESSPGQAT